MRLARWISIAVLGIAASSAAAQTAARPDPLANPWMARAGFLSDHPDMRYRLSGLEAYGQKQYDVALDHFRRASYYGDKPSQAMVGEMYWEGLGTARDRALGYVWMDLAAERGYPGFLRPRERYWHALDAQERARALDAGPAVYARYGDAVAEPRLARKLRTSLRNVVGSRTGFGSNGKVLVVRGLADNVAAIVATIDSSEFYDRRYWEPKQYRQWQDAVWSDPRPGTVRTGDLERVRDEGERPEPGATGGEDQSR